MVFLVFFKDFASWHPSKTDPKMDLSWTPSWEAFWVHLEGIWACLGGVLGRLGGILGSLWASWAVLGASWGRLGHVLGGYWAVLGCLENVFCPKVKINGFPCVFQGFCFPGLAS